MFCNCQTLPKAYYEASLHVQQGHSHQYGWSGFNQTTFRYKNHKSANIHKFGGVPSRPVGSHIAKVDGARD